MKRILLATAGTFLSVSLAFAQTMSAPASNNAGAPTTSMGAPATANPMGAAHDSGKAAASGDTNQAVTTTGANADQPAKGANSFTKRQAAGRIAKKGYSHVTGLTKDADGVWRGTGMKGGQSVQVWLDYKGNVGQQS